MASYENKEISSLSEQELLWAMGLTLLPGIGNITAKRLIAFCGGLEGVYRQTTASLHRIPGIGPALSRALIQGQALRLAEAEMRFARKEQIRVLVYLDKAYPERLKMCEDGPVVLYVKGAGALECRRNVAVVGTRKATEYGREATRKLVQGLTGKVDQVISGLAYGIDAEAHKAALEYGIPTFAVLAHGLDHLYPAVHRKLANRMLETGGLITEFASGSLPDREHFPRRNRIIAGMCDATIVVEAADKGGALITADLADSYNRDVFAMPGRTSDPMSSGCLKLIRTQKAGLICRAEDLLYDMRWDEEKPASGHQTSLFPGTDPLAEGVWTKLSECRSLDDLLQDSGMSQGRLRALLLEMELEGWVEAIPGNRWKRR